MHCTNNGAQVLANAAKAQRSLLKLAGVVVLVVFAALTFRRNEDWADGSTIWQFVGQWEW